VHAQTENKSDDSKDSFYEEAKHTFHQFRKHHMQILLGELSTKVGKR
jgi:hypothetical protein